MKLEGRSALLLAAMFRGKSLGGIERDVPEGAALKLTERELRLVS